MRLLDHHNAEAYLRATGRIDAQERVTTTELGGGVSNMVLLVEREEHAGKDFVLKQARAQLRTEQPWFSSVERIWREADVLRICQHLLSGASASVSLSFSTPAILFEDRDEYLIGMTAAPRPNTVWKAQLLSGATDQKVAAAAGALLGTLHSESWRNAEIAQPLGDQSLFDQLRVDPYYRTLAALCPDAREGIKRLLDTLADTQCSLVHADFSPKNLLVFSSGLMVVDFETGHYGDPAFDLGFFLSHLLLKACYFAPLHTPYLKLIETFRASYDCILAAKVSAEELSKLWARGMQNLAGCAWARLDGKSPVEYLTDQNKRERIRRLCREVFASRPGSLDEVLQMARIEFDRVTKATTS